MFRGVCPRVNSCGSFWVLSLLVFAVSVIGVDAYSCHEVRTAFQLRQVGPLHRVPETPGTDVDLLVCKHQGPSCCTRKMEESYQFAVKRETLHNIHSYSYELEHLISGHSDAFQDMFQYLLSFSQGHLSSLLEGTYSSLSRHALPHVNQLFSSLSLYLRGANVSVEAAVHQFFNNIFPLAYTRLINPGIEGSMMVGSEMSDCLRMIRQDVNPFGPHPAVMAHELAGALGAGRQLGLALEEGLEVMNATEHASLSKECVKGLVKMVYCSHCRGLTLIKPCVGYCLNVMRGCLASVSELDQPWRRYTSLLEQLTQAMAGHHSLELALLGVRGHVNEALLYAQLHGPLITATVDKVCGLSTGEPTSMQPTSPEVTTSTMTSSSPLPSAAPSRPLPEQWPAQLAHLRSSFPLKPSKNNKHSLRTLSREFLVHLQRYKSFFAALPEMLCEGENVVDDSTCWSGDGVVESYTGRVVGNGLHAQRQNPEVKVRSVDPAVAEVKERLENFNQETHEKFPKLGQMEAWDELGSGEIEEGSTTDCDDEDGCQSSGDGQEKNLHKEASSEGKPIGRQPGGKSPQENPSKPPSVRVIGGSPSASWARPWSLALLLSGLCSQWILF
ncbi:glypican-5 isoform X1 [Acanthochromis polyacanthus]|uniref:glypican-5 isoform X1 n=1 Tax=Acanthochromis polyacanthus TaxID=80966 RepID=UPI002233F98D|nr:glypican-5 isoform X1 [Acanthochromis polyacanthus]